MQDRLEEIRARVLANEFVAVHTREDVPYLLDLVEKLQIEKLQFSFRISTLQVANQQLAHRVKELEGPQTYEEALNLALLEDKKLDRLTKMLKESLARKLKS